MKIFIFVLGFILFNVNLIGQAQCSHAKWDVKSTASDSLDVLHYNINLDIIYLSQHHIGGFTELKIVPLHNGINQLSLDLQHLVPDSVFVEQSKITNWQYNDTLLSIPLLSAINTSDTVMCKVYYHGNPQVDPSGWGGFYFSNDSTFAFNMAVGMQDDPHNYGRVWYPCVDNFTDRATYDFNITVKNNNVAVCNGTLVGTTSANGVKSYHWNLQNDIPTYLASVAIGEYVALEDTFNSMNGPIPIAIYVPQNKVAAAQGSFIHLKSILEAYEFYYGPYRWERIGYVGIPFNSGAMEHATSIHIGLGYINGATTYETLIAHELSHHWFGDLVTCHSAPDMWLNEGWAVFSESMYQEYIYGREAYKNNMRAELFDVLKNTHHNDNGYRAVAGVPHEYTYGSTVYDKGGTVAHSLRGYLGDSLFFSALRAYMSQNAFSDQTSYEFRDFITAHTGISVVDFFDSWVFEPGFSQFAVDSFFVNSSTAGLYNIEVAARQALNHKPNFALSNRMPITFMDDNWNRKDTIVQFSGQSGSEVFQIAFNPTVVFVDLEETFADATTDYSKVINQTGILDYQQSYFKLDVQQITDSALFQITHNWVAPDTLGITYPGLRISSKRYWTVAANNHQKLTAQGQFRYWRTADLDADIITSSQDSIVILYREHGGQKWRKQAFQKMGNWVTGYLWVDNLKSGEYALAVYDASCLGISDKSNLIREIELKISPNPSKDEFRFEGNFDFQTTIRVYDSLGKEVAELQMEVSNGKSEKIWRPSNLPVGAYFVTLSTSDSTIIHRTKLIISE